VTTKTTASKGGKRYRAAAEGVDSTKSYAPEEALDLLKQVSQAKFDETVEVHVKTNADPRHADQLIRVVVLLPHGTGKPQRVLAFVQGTAVAAAREAGADYIADDEIIERIEKQGWVEFDVAVATQDVMSRIGKLGRVLGRRGLMPNPRTGTVVQPQDVGRAIREAKGGRIELRMDKTANLHCSIGKVSFSTQDLLDNLAMVLDAMTKARPEGVKGQLVKAIYATTTMGPSARLDTAQALALSVQ
jgi:large subunit ribosomal protein L1